MSPIIAIFMKELTETLRDRRTVFNAFVLGPLLSPLLMIGMLSMTANKLSEQAEKRLALPVAGAEHAPQLVEWLRGQSVDIQDAPADPEQALRNKDVDVVLRITADYPEQWRKSLPAPLEVMRDKQCQHGRRCAYAEHRHARADYASRFPSNHADEQYVGAGRGLRQSEQFRKLLGGDPAA